MYIEKLSGFNVVYLFIMLHLPVRSILCLFKVVCSKTGIKLPALSIYNIYNDVHELRLRLATILRTLFGLLWLNRGMHPRQRIRNGRATELH